MYNRALKKAGWVDEENPIKIVGRILPQKTSDNSDVCRRTDFRTDETDKRTNEETDETDTTDNPPTLSGQTKEGVR